jgi:hypothetical protein
MGLPAMQKKKAPVAVLCSFLICAVAAATNALHNNNTSFLSSPTLSSVLSLLWCIVGSVRVQDTRTTHLLVA